MYWHPAIDSGIMTVLAINKVHAAPVLQVYKVLEPVLLEKNKAEEVLMVSPSFYADVAHTHTYTQACPCACTYTQTYKHVDTQVRAGDAFLKHDWKPHVTVTFKGLNKP